MSEWIERVKQNPKIRGQYLVYREGVCLMEFANFGTSKGWDNGRFRGDHDYKVTHWMPLPKPPEALCNHNTK